MHATASRRPAPDGRPPRLCRGETGYSGRTRFPPGGQVKRWICALLVLALAGCIPIGFRSQNLPYAAIAVKAAA